MIHMASIDFDWNGFPGTLGFLGISLLFLLALFWSFQFAVLMRLEEERFPGQYVRFGWIAAFLLLWPIAPFAFLLWNTGPRRRHGRHDAS
ncbi:MAG: hypothetical protein ACE5H3_02760 [Planctomycetota bacterium]